ncbi:MAG: efflux transporter outer membrane subunit [Pseudomonadales bacterium]
MLLVAALVAGCAAVGPDYQRPEVDLKDDWTLASAEGLVETVPGAPIAWWEVFTDPLLTELVQEAYAQNLDLEVAGLRILEARARLGIATGNQYPQSQSVNGSALATGLSTNRPNFVSALADDTFTDAALSFDAAWEIDFWGRYRRGVEAAEADLAAALAAYDAGLVSLTAETARIYFLVRTIEERIRFVRNDIAIQGRSLEIVQVQARNGLVTELDVQQAATLYESTAAQLPLLQGDLERARNALSVLLGQMPGDLEARLGTGDIPDPPAEVAVGVPAELLRRRPDVRLAELLAAGQSARVGVAQSEKYPAFGLAGSIGLRASDARGADLGDIFTGDSVEYFAGPVFSWPILNYGRISNSVRVQDARLQQQLVLYQSTVLGAAREVEDALAGYVRAREAAAHYARGVEAAGRAVDLALLQYRDGIADYQRVLETQRQLNIQHQFYAQTRGDIVTSLVGIYRALGGGWELRDGRPVIDETTRLEMQERTNWGGLLDPSEVPAEPEVPAPAGEQPLLRGPDW